MLLPLLISNMECLEPEISAPADGKACAPIGEEDILSPSGTLWRRPAPLSPSPAGRRNQQSSWREDRIDPCRGTDRPDARHRQILRSISAVSLGNSGNRRDGDGAEGIHQGSRRPLHSGSPVDLEQFGAKRYMPGQTGGRVPRSVCRVPSLRVDRLCETRWGRRSDPKIEQGRRGYTSHGSMEQDRTCY